ncbi:MAG: carbohydrate binding family 9 domain-containing protein [Chitinophagaceae bacterium]|nr:carbohydrate binding family 9 domain-containing protein [Chitinophagaceae bacterium]MBL0273614.1 carbohydrate binding family 9 domain-containing protein [Chitinophagaceae bacterium]
MLLRKLIWLPLLLVCGISLYSQERSLQAVKVSQAPKIDGNLNDEAWVNVPEATNFIQNYPVTGKPASQKSIIKVIYDNSAIYVGAYLYDNPALIRKQITARDAEQQKDVDLFSIFFDTYNDDQNGFQFVVTSANVQSDAKLDPNYGGRFGDYGDRTWDAVWESKVQIQKDGWTVEMKIPYISLRFAKKDLQNWGLQFLRVIRRTNESCYWNPVKPEVNGFVNQFGNFTGLIDLEPPLRLSFSPYVSTGYRSIPQTNGTGFTGSWLRNGGMDVKYGINESLTLDVTLVPDFGQVVSDNVINNLTPYEIKFQENRQFFTEGTEIFNKAGLFYSRRVGATPSGYNGVNNFLAGNPNWELVRNPSTSQLYNATKFSGRNKNKLGIGIFNAITAPMDAKIHNIISGKDSIIRTSQLTNYNILVLDQALKGRSSITFTNTNVISRSNARNANVTALDVALYNKKNTHTFNGKVRYSKIWGKDSYDGFNTTMKFEKISGSWRYYVSENVESKKYDPNDLGILPAPNEVTTKLNVSYNQFQPTHNFIQYSYTLENRLTYLYQPNAYNRYDINGTAFWIFKNFWDVTLKTQLTPFPVHDYFELRTDGRYLNYPLNFIFDFSGSTDSRKRLFVRFNGVFARLPEFNNNYYGRGLGFRYRFSNRFSLDLQMDGYKEKNNLGYAFTRESNNEPIVGFRDVKANTNVLSGIYNFTPRLNLTLRVRHYWNEVKYLSFHNVDSKGNLTNRPFITNWNDNVNIFNLDAFLTWDFRLGSRLIVGYKNWLGDGEYVPISSAKNSYFHNLGEIFNQRHGNELTVRFIYFLDYNQLRRKR